MTHSKGGALPNNIATAASTDRPLSGRACHHAYSASCFAGAACAPAHERDRGCAAARVHGTSSDAPAITNLLVVLCLHPPPTAICCFHAAFRADVPACFTSTVAPTTTYAVTFVTFLLPMCAYLLRGSVAQALPMHVPIDELVA